ncbi:hypothetical protein AB2T85_06760 [Clostridium butyricum]|uniref:hypothetical protein n=1 Tax=Clostridium butyricum TaxID=1492 RepID=UPI0034678044
MSNFKRTITTQKGHALMAKMLTGVTVEFTRITTSEHDYYMLEDFELEALAGVENEKQSVLVSDVELTNESYSRVHSVITNTELTEGYYVKAICLYANDPDEGEILYSITVCESGKADWLPPFNTHNVSSIEVNLDTVISNAKNVSLEVNPAALISVKTFNKFKDDVTSQLNEIVPNTTLWYLENIENIRTRATVVVQGFYDLEDDVVGKYRVLQVDGTEIWNTITVGDDYSFKISNNGEIAKNKELTIYDKKLKLLSDNGIIYASMFGISTLDGFDNSKLIQLAITKGNKVILPEGSFYINSSLKYNHSNLRLIGNNTVIHSDVHSLLTSSLYEDTDITKPYKNIYIKGITFKRDTIGTFDEIDKLMMIRHCDGFELNKCKFIGWNGDALCIDLLYKLKGNGTSEADEHTYSTVVSRNIKIHDCLFDGVNNENSQAIFICQGTNIEIIKNKFINTTRKGMPGAIDLEPWQYKAGMHIIEDVDIMDNIFENINGSGGVVNIHFRKKGDTTTVIDYPIKNIRIKNNKMSKCKSQFFSVRHLHSVVNETYWESQNIEVIGNTFTGGGIEADWKIFGCHGINGLTIKDNIFNQVKGVGYIGNCSGTGISDVADKNINLVFENNIFNDFAPFAKESQSYQPLIELGENIGFLCENNKFIANTTKFTNYVDAMIFRFIPATTGVTVKNYIFKNNFISNEQDSTRIKYFLTDNRNNNLTSPTLVGNIMNTNITEHLTTAAS